MQKGVSFRLAPNISWGALFTQVKHEVALKRCNLWYFGTAYKNCAFYLHFGLILASSHILSLAGWPSKNRMSISFDRGSGRKKQHTGTGPGI